MDDKNKNTTEQYYIVSLDNGIREEEPITIETFNSFSDGSKLVQLNKTVFGVFKTNSSNPEMTYIDDYDLIKADIAELFDIDHEETKRIVNEEENIGVFTALNYSKDIETRISATTVINHMVSAINKGLITGQEAIWLGNVLKISQDSKENPIKDSTIIEDLINLGTYSLEKDIELQTGMKLDPKLSSAIHKKYIRMILFDLIIGRKYRGLDYYLISKVNEFGKPIWLDSYLSPISVSNNIEKDKLVGDNEYQLNNHLIDREILLKVLFEKHYDEIKKTVEALTEAKKLYLDAISRIIYNNTEISKAQELEETIITNLNKVTEYQQEKEKKLDPEQKMNKVEKTMATQSLNVKVTTKLDLIQKKYPFNPKEHPELLEKQKNKKKDGVSLIVEEEKKNGFAFAAIIVSIIALICGLGIGIAYVLITFGN